MGLSAAATKGIRHPNLGIFLKPLSRIIDQGLFDESGHSAKTPSFGDSGVPDTKIIAESAANEADSSEASLTIEQKLKAERLKRAKVFAAIIKSGAAPLKADPLRGLSIDPPVSGVSSSGAGRDREGSTAPVDFDAFDENENSSRKAYVDESNEQRSKRIYRSRSNRHEEVDDSDDEDEDDDDEKDKEEDENHDKRDYKHSRKTSRSHRSSPHIRDRHKCRKKHSSKDRNSRHYHNHDGYSSYENQHSMHRQKDSSLDDGH